LLRERVGAVLWLALLVLLAGTAVGLNLHVVRLGQGDVLLVLAAALFAVGVVLAKYLLREVSTLTVMAAKMSAGSVFLLAYVAATGRLKAVAHLSGLQWEYVLVTGLILLAFTVTAFLGLRYASATAVTAIPAASPIITTLLVVAASGRIKLAPSDELGLLLTLAAVAAIFVVGQRADRSAWEAQRKAVAA
jgi:drug/metabolite transporter (DMT)-like permease